MNNAILLDKILKPEHQEAGLWLTNAPADPTILNMIRGGSVVKSWRVESVTFKEIIDEADKVLIS